MAKEPIPGEHDHTTQAPTDRGIVGTTGYGIDLPSDSTNDPTTTDEDRAQARWEGGGRVRHPPKSDDDATQVPRPGPDTEAHPGERRDSSVTRE